MASQVPQKRARMMSSASARPPVGLHIELPPNDLAQFKVPGEGQPQPQAPAPAPAQAQAGPAAVPPSQQQGPLFASEVKEMFYYIRGAALKGSEIVRYQTDMQQLQRVSGQAAPVPRYLLASFRQDTERLDQVCDVIEAKIQRLISVLVREINREKAKAAEEAAAKAALEKEQAAAAAAASMANTNDPAAAVAVKAEDMDMDTQPDDGQPPDANKMPPPPEPNSSLAPPRVSSTAPSVVSLSNLPSSSPDLGEAPAADQANKARRTFDLKLDLSAPNLRGSFIGPVPNTAAPDPPRSPVTLAPKSAKPRNDDPTNAFLIGPSFNPALIQQLSAKPLQSAFGQSNSMPFSGVADPSDTNALIPDILSSVNAAAQQGAAATAQTNASMEALQGDIIDLTGNSPVRGQVNMPINVDEETIDLTVDSPTIPLSQFVALKKASIAEGGEANGDSGPMTGIEGSSAEAAETKAENVTPDGQQVGEVTTGATADTTLEGLVSSLAGTEGEAQPTNGDAAIPSGLPTDATSLLATLTAAAQNSTNDNSANGAGSTNDANSNVFQGLISAGDFGDLGSMGLGGAGGLGGDMGMDLGAMGMDMSMYLPSAGAGVGDASTTGMFDGFGGLIGDGTGTGVSMDFDMSIFANMEGAGGDGSNTQNN